MTENKSKPLNRDEVQKYTNEESLTLIDILLIIARHLKIIIVFPIAISIMMYIYLKIFSIPLFISSAKIMSSSAKSGNTISGAAGLAAQLGINIPSSQSNTQWVYPDIVKSRTLAKGMLKRKFDTKEFGPQKSLLHILSNNNIVSDVDVLNNIVVSKIINMIDIEKSSGSIYTLQITAKEAVFARDFVSMVIEELDLHQRVYNSAKISEARHFIQERIADTKNELDAVEDVLKNFRARNRRIENSPALQLEQQRLLREVTVLTSVFTTLKQQLETAKIQEFKDSDYVIVIDPPDSPLAPSKPNIRFIVVIVFVISTGIAILLAFLKETFDREKMDKNGKLEELKLLFRENITDLLFFKKS